MKADEATSRQVGEVLKRMLAAYAAKDIEGVMQCYHHWSGVLAIGSSGDEIRLGPGDLRAGFAADFAQPFDLQQELTWLSVAGHGDTAWAAAGCRSIITSGEMVSTVDARLTAVLIKQHDQWLIAQSHFSLPSMEPSVRPDMQP